MRADGRENDELRGIDLKLNYTDNPDGSVLIEMGKTKVICTAMVEDKVPIWMRNSNSGWLTAEYSMLPGSTSTRKQRDSTRGKQDGRTVEIQRLIGRSLRSCIDLNLIGQRTIWIDVDVIQADGGTRCASITGGFVALYLAMKKLYDQGVLEAFPIKNFLGAVSVGKVDDQILLDLNYIEDSRAQVDMNVIMNDQGEFTEVQGSGEGGTFSQEEFSTMLALAQEGIRDIFVDQRLALEQYLEDYKNEKNSTSN
ncbi:MAG: ribonuclease PH [Bacillota bacterium]|nr:ribonuclease PH [Bacillota bacterium]